MALFSEHWHRVAALKPRLVPQATVQRQEVRGQVWYLLADPDSGRACRLNAVAYALAGRLDGRRSVQQVWDGWQALDGDAAAAGPAGSAPTDAAPEPPTQDEAIEILARLREQGLLEVDRDADFARLLPHLAQGRRQTRRFNPLAWRLPLGDPSRLVDRLLPLGRWLFSRFGLCAWALALLATVALALAQAEALAAYADAALARPMLALWALLAWLPLKALHEAAHALALRVCGAAVHEAGVTLMVGLPVPYVDASAATALPRRRDRLRVSAAGIVAELALAGPALLLWSLSRDGPWREAAFAWLGAATVSALLFNANPLQRLDGYHIACDLLALPNLASRSRSWWLEWLQRHLLRLPGLRPMPVARRESPWLIAYAPLAWAWQVLVLASAVAWLAGWSALAGAALAALALVQIGLLPPWRLWRSLARSAAASGAVARRLRLAAAALLLGLPALLALPLPQQQVALGVVWPPEQAQLRPQTGGFVQALLRDDGATVAAGEPVLRLRDPQLDAALTAQQARLAALESEWHAALAEAGGSGSGERGARSAELQARLALAGAELARLQQRADGLLLRAGVAGTLALPHAADLLGRHAAQGRLLGQVLTAEPPTVRVALPEDQALALRAQRGALSLWRADGNGRPQPAALRRETPAALQQLPSAALSRRHGGRIDTDPLDSDALRSLQPVVLLDVQALPSGDTAATAQPLTQRLGARVWVRFDGGTRALGRQAWDGLARWWHGRANPQG